MRGAPLRRSLASALVIALAITTAFAQDVLHPGRPDPSAQPFIFRPRLARGGQPTFRDTYPTYVPRWFEAIEEHQPGALDDAVRQVSRWTHDQLVYVVVTVEDDRRPRAETIRILKRAVLLHTDVATAAAIQGATPDIAWISDTSSLHFGVALELVEWLRNQTEVAFAREWYRATAAFLVSRFEIISSPIFLERAVAMFRNDADLLLMAGAVHELLASPRVQEGADLRNVNKCGSADQNLEAAERFFRRALDAAPSMTEARVRFARVIGQQGRHEQALGEFKRAFAATSPPGPALQYFMHLFAGEEEEALKHTQAARAAYERAIALRPHVRFGYLAVSRLERRSGDNAAAIEAARRMLVAEEPSDPWAEYYAAGQAPAALDLLEQLGRPFKRPQ